jgi:hypothetical protein
LVEAFCSVGSVPFCGMGVCGHKRGIAEGAIWVQRTLVEHKGIRYTIRTRIVRHEWCVAVHPADGDVADKIIVGSRSAAEKAAHAMIDSWLRDRARTTLQSIFD